MRVIEELIDSADPALPLVKEWIADSSTSCEVLPPSQDQARVLVGLQVTTRSTMGAIAYETGGLLINGGWLRILGSGHPKLTRNILDWNEGRSSGFLLVADDVVGGYFAINGGAFSEDNRSMYYWAPDTLQWEQMDFGYSDFIQWSLSGRLDRFYADLRWPGWQSDLGMVSADQCFTFYPFLWTKEGSVNGSSRKAVPTSEQYALNVELASQMN